MPYRRKKLTFAISSPDEFLLDLSTPLSRTTEAVVKDTQLVYAFSYMFSFGQTK